MEARFLSYHDGKHFSDFSLSLEQNVVEKPQDLLMHMVENDFDYMETHLEITNSDNLWNNEHKHDEDDEEMSNSDVSTISKMDSIKEDFAKVLTEWQEHIGYLQATDMDEYMDIVELNTNTTDERSLSSTENIFQDEQTVHESNHLLLQQEDVEEKPVSNQNTSDSKRRKDSYNKIKGKVKDNGKVQPEVKSELIQPKHSKCKSKLKKNIRKYDSVGIDTSANLFTKQRRKKKEKSLTHNKNTRNNDQDNKEPANQMPVLEAGDVKSLLEQFEASEDALITSCPNNKTNIKCKTKSPIKCNEIQRKQAKESQISNLHKNIRDALPKEVIDKIKTSACKRTTSVIPTIPNIENNSRTNGTRMQDAAASLLSAQNKLLNTVTDNTKNKITDGGLVQLDHDYCSTSSSINNVDNNCEYEKCSDSDKVTILRNDSQRPCLYYTVYEKQSFSSNSNTSLIKNIDYSTENNSKKDSGLESGEVSDNSEEQSGVSTVSDVQIHKPVKELHSGINDCKNEASRNHKSQQDISNNASNCSTIHIQPVSSSNPLPEMKIQSVLATNILQLRQSVLNKTKSVQAGTQKSKQMVSVLKRSINAQQAPVVKDNNETAVTTITSSNHKVQNIIVQKSEEKLVQEEEKKPPRKKLNLAEYRSRREQNRSDNSRTNSPLQRMILVYVHHASTTTEPIKDDPKNLIWSEREIVSILKPKVEIDEAKERSKPPTCDVGIQTYETVFEFPTKSLIDVDERREQSRNKDVQDENRKSCERHRFNSNSSRSRSRSKTRSRSKSRSRGRSRSRSRSRSSSNQSKSCKRSNTRRRRISHRRSSVSSNSSWSSRSYSHSRSRNSRSHSRSCSGMRSSFSSESRYSRSRSRSSRSRSRSSRYSSSSRSNWSRRRRDREYHRSYDRRRQNSMSSYHSYKDWRRSPSNAYRRSYENWYDREKQRQVEERRVIYVGRLAEGITKADLRRRFEAFGPVVDISIHFREHGDNYGFVTFAHKNDAYEAVEHGNDDPSLPRYDLCFGGRRAFCKVKYADLDGMASNSLCNGGGGGGGSRGVRGMLQDNEDNTFDLLLKEAKAKLRKRKV
ncbi:peroxisome proliferator-activated receptor gamma coactivator 1-alpha-like isoform X2 [Ceratina calcarata]|uniref:Peroxisome proliferator-activated receptor gamma coactivator 1-alpha-like isoform X2 n=1 Tax=Ceratina calcarata TaxID=156304 RepID=A0AAJ7J6B4_9HYME|nr:peroxisome proliferator-activated receptor gamma coactivator 1-alpha-like isoform X2 [Ceratina calcarata]